MRAWWLWWWGGGLLAGHLQSSSLSSKQSLLNCSLTVGSLLPAPKFGWGEFSAPRACPKQMLQASPYSSFSKTGPLRPRASSRGPRRASAPPRQQGRAWPWNWGSSVRACSTALFQRASSGGCDASAGCTTASQKHTLMQPDSCVSGVMHMVRYGDQHGEDTETRQSRVNLPPCLVVEHAVALGCQGQRQVVRDHHTRVQLALLERSVVGAL